MLKNKSLASNWILRFAITFTVATLVWMGIGYSQNTLTIADTSVLQGEIVLEPTRPLEEPTKIQPGTPVKLKLIVENKGQKPSAEGEVLIQFGFAKPLDNQPQSITFATEKVKLPSIEPGKKATITFATEHTWPTLFDFVRFDWSLREYKAMAIIEDEEKMIGTLAITVSAYYYPGVKKEFPSEFPAL